MPRTSIVVFDNALNSQNQDYLPSRFILQKEVIEQLITNLLEGDNESLIGLVPLAQKSANDVLTPTRLRHLLSSFAYQQDLYKNPDHLLALFQSDRSLHISQLSDKTLYIFLSTPVEKSDDVFINLLSMASKGIKVKAVCFGDAVEFGNCLQKESGFSNYIQTLIVHPEDDFNTSVLEFLLDGDSKYADEDLEEAIRRSMVEK